MSAEAFKDYNEMLKTFDNLTKREGELLQKLSQSEHAGSAQRKEWATELAAVINAAATLDECRTKLVEKLKAEIEELCPPSASQTALSTNTPTRGSKR